MSAYPLGKTLLQDTFELPDLVIEGEPKRTLRTRMQPGPFSGCAVILALKTLFCQCMLCEELDVLLPHAEHFQHASRGAVRRSKTACELIICRNADTRCFTAISLTMRTLGESAADTDNNKTVIFTFMH